MSIETAWKPPGSDKLIGVDGNAFAILGFTQRALRGAGAPADYIERFLQQAKAGDYDALLFAAMLALDGELEGGPMHQAEAKPEEAEQVCSRCGLRPATRSYAGLRFCEECGEAHEEVLEFSGIEKPCAWCGAPVELLVGEKYDPETYSCAECDR